MSTHFIDLVSPVRGKKVGMSTSYKFDGNYFSVEWKGKAKSLPAKAGDRIMVSCSGRFPKVVVMVPPKDPVARVAWQYYFFGGKRVSTLEELEKAIEQANYPAGWELSGPNREKRVGMALSTEGNCAFAYRSAMDGWCRVPWAWWAGESATPEEVQSLLKKLHGI